MSKQGKEVFGTFTFNGIIFDASYRYDGDVNHQGGYNKCLVIYRGNNRSVDGHTYFGDDKFQVNGATFNGNTVILELSFPLYEAAKGFSWNLATLEQDKKITLQLR